MSERRKAEFGRRCRECGTPLPPRNTSGLCRPCYQRELMRARRRKPS